MRKLAFRRTYKPKNHQWRDYSITGKAKRRLAVIFLQETCLPAVQSLLIRYRRLSLIFSLQHRVNLQNYPFEFAGAGDDASCRVRGQFTAAISYVPDARQTTSADKWCRPPSRTTARMATDNEHLAIQSFYYELGSKIFQDLSGNIAITISLPK